MNKVANLKTGMEVKGIVKEIQGNKIFMLITFEDGTQYQPNMIFDNYRGKVGDIISVKVNKLKEDGSFTIKKS